MKKVLETDGGDDCTTLGIYLKPTNCTLETVNVMLPIFYYNEKYVNKFNEI